MDMCGLLSCLMLRQTAGKVSLHVSVHWVVSGHRDVPKQF